MQRGDTDLPTLSEIVDTRVKLLDKREPIRSAMGPLAGASKLFPVVLDHGRAYGIVVAKALMRHHVEPAAHIEKFALATGTIPISAGLEEAARFLAARNIPFAPVVDEREKVKGVVRARDVIEVIEAPQGHASSYAREAPVFTQSTGLGTAIHEFSHHNAPYAPTLDDSRARIEGVLHERGLVDVLMTADRRPPGHVDFTMGENESRAELPVRSFLDPAFEVFSPNADVSDCIESLSQGIAVVVAQGALVRGILTPVDILRGHFEEGATPVLNVVPKQRRTEI